MARPRERLWPRLTFWKPCKWSASWPKEILQLLLLVISSWTLVLTVWMALRSCSGVFPRLAESVPLCYCSGLKPLNLPRLAGAGASCWHRHSRADFSFGTHGNLRSSISEERWQKEPQRCKRVIWIFVRRRTEQNEKLFQSPVIVLVPLAEFFFTWLLPLNRWMICSCRAAFSQQTCRVGWKNEPV